MRKSIGKFFVLLLLLAPPARLLGQEGFKEKYNVEFVAVPLVMSNPNFGTGAGALGMVLFDMDPENEDVQSSSIALTGLYSDRKSHVLALGGTLLPNPDYRFKTGIVDGRIRSILDFDGIPGTADFTTSFNALFLEGQYRFAANLFAGIRTVVSYRAYSPDNDAGAEYLQMMDAENASMVSLGPVMSYDTRDNRFFPFSGIFSELSCMLNPSALGSDVSYHVLEGFLNGYKQTIPNHVVAGRVYGRFTPEQTPFSGLSTLGRKSDLRGYVAGEHVANNLISTQLEYRWHFYEKWALVGFVGEAMLFDAGEINRDSFFFSCGGGIRYRLSDERRVNFRADYAWGEGNSDGFYVGISEAF